MYVKSTKVRSGNNSYEYLSLVEGYRDEAGQLRQRTPFRLGEASRLRKSGKLDRIIEALRGCPARRRTWAAASTSSWCHQPVTARSMASIWSAVTASSRRASSGSCR